MASGSKRVILAALVGNALIAVTKFIAAALTGSSAMLSEGIHSVVDTGNQILLLYSLRRAARPANQRFPFGHGKEVYFWSFVVAIMIFAVGSGISIYEGISHLLHPEPMRNVTVNYVVLALALAFEGAAWYFAFVEFNRARGDWGYVEAVQRGKDPTLFVVLFEDSAAIAGLLVALLGVLLADLTGMALFDGAASVIIGVILGATAAWLAYETKGLLIGESANRAVVARIRELIADAPGVEHVNEVLSMHMGPEFILLNVSVTFDSAATATDIERAVARLDAGIKAEFPEVKRIFVEAEARAALASATT
ncbi:MAG: cation diffusion facilitator family transporter [Pseudomonadales bacterium]